MKKLTGSLFAFMVAVILFSTQLLCVYAEAGAEDTSVRISLLGKYDSADTASIKQINSISKTIQFRNHDTGKNYTLKYDNTSQIMDIHGDPVSATLLEVGEVVDITFLKGTKHLNSLIVSKEAWVDEGVTDFSLVSNDETAKINGSVLHLTHKTMIISDGQAVNPEDILDTDTLRVSGIDKEIYSIVVTRGHGYVSLSSDKVNDRSLVGAWIELDKEVIRKITPRMLISAPEGSYNVSIAGNGTKFSSEIVVNRNEETIIDTSVVEVEKVKRGNVTFIVTPSDARVFVDDDEVRTEVPNSFIYGKHKVHVMAEGYESQDHYLKVAEPDAKIFIELDKKDGDDDSSEADSTEEDSSDSSESVDTTPSYDYSSSSASYRSNVDDSSTSQRSNSAATATSKRATITPSASSTTSATAAVDSSAAATTASAASTESTTSDSSSTSDTGTSDSTGATTTADDSSNTTTTAPDSSDLSNTADSGNSADDETDKDLIPGCTVTFDAPVGAEAYLDGNYLGIMPVSFAKSAGQHMVTLKQAGYETRSYTIQIDREKTNVSYTFPDLVKEKSADDDSGNSSTTDDTDNGSSYNTGDDQQNQGGGSSDNSGSNNSDEGNTGSSDAGNTDTSDTGNTDDQGSGNTDNPDNPGAGDTGSPDSGNTDTSETGNPDNPQQGEGQEGDNTGNTENPDTGDQGGEGQNASDNPDNNNPDDGSSEGEGTGTDSSETTDTTTDGGHTDNGGN